MSSPQPTLYGQSYSQYSMATSQGYTPSSSPQQPPPPPPPQFDNQRSRSPDTGDKGRGFNPQYVPSYTRDENNLLRQPPPPPPPPAAGRSRTFWPWKGQGEGHLENICKMLLIIQREVFSLVKRLPESWWEVMSVFFAWRRSCGGDVQMVCCYGNKQQILQCFIDSKWTYFYAV